MSENGERARENRDRMIAQAFIAVTIVALVLLTVLQSAGLIKF